MLYDMWDMLQQGQINNAQADAYSAKRDNAHTSLRLHKEVQRLESKINTLSLVSQALWELVRDSSELTEQDIESKINEIDLRDGKKDGKITGKPIDCPNCKRPTHTKLKMCMYCSEPLGEQHAFD